jgi:hypothetical protein
MFELRSLQGALPAASKIKLLASKERAKRPRRWMAPPRTGIT